MSLWKSTSASWLRFFDEGDGNLLGFVIEAFVVYWLSWYMLPSRPKEQFDFNFFCPSCKQEVNPFAQIIEYIPAPFEPGLVEEMATKMIEATSSPQQQYPT